MAYTDKTDTFEYKLRIDNTDLIDLIFNDQEIALQIPQFNRPLLKYVSATEVGIRTNKLGASNETDVLFSDGHRVIAMQTGIPFNSIFDITRTADWTSEPGSQGGLRPGLSETPNRWYAIYFIRDVFSAIMAGDDTLPLQANVGTLNSRYGKNRWAYAGMIRNGDNAGATSDILEFIQVRDKTYLLNFASDGGGNFNDGKGLRLASSNTVDLDWVYVSGTGIIEVPNHINLAGFHVSAIHDTVNNVKDSAGVKLILDSGAPGGSSTWRENFIAIPQDGVKMFGATSQDRAILLNAWYDNVLGLGYNALI